MMEWMPYGQSVDEFRSHVRTFAASFPNVTLASARTSKGVYMLGSAGPITSNQANIRQVLDRPGRARRPGRPVDNPVNTVDEWAGTLREIAWLDDAGDVARSAGAGPLILDDRPVTEYFLLRRVFGPPSPRMTEPNLRAATPPG